MGRGKSLIVPQRAVGQRKAQGSRKINEILFGDAQVFLELNFVMTSCHSKQPGVSSGNRFGV